MGLLDKAGAGNEVTKAAVPKAKPAAIAIESKSATPVKAAKVAKAAKPAKAAKAKKAKAPRARPMGLGEDYELASNMNRRISWLVNFIINFGVLFAAIFISMSDTSVVTTILYAVSLGIIILNAMFIPMKFSRNLGQFVSRTKFVRGDGSNPLFLHGIFVNITGLLALVGLILVGTQLQSLTDTDNTMAIVMFSFGTIFIILWFVDRFLRNGSEMGQGLYDLLFGAYLVKYVPSEDEKATGIWARLENMGNFGDQLVKKQEERQAKKELQAAEKAKESEKAEPQDD